MRLLVLGAGGVIGSAVARESVRRGHDVHGLLRPSTSTERLDACNEPITHHRHDLEDVAALAVLIARSNRRRSSMQRFRPDTRVLQTRLQMLQHGLIGTLSLLEALSRARSRVSLVYLGSAISYGTTGMPHHPSDRLQPGAFRGVVKAAESLMIGQYGRETGSSITELRLFSVYGPWEQRKKLLPRLFAAALVRPRASECGASSARLGLPGRRCRCLSGCLRAHRTGGGDLQRVFGAPPQQS